MLFQVLPQCPGLRKAMFVTAGLLSWKKGWCTEMPHRSTRMDRVITRRRLGAMQPEGIIVCSCTFYIWALVCPWILQLYVAILKEIELRENHKVDAKPPCEFTLSQFSFLLIRSFPCTIFCIYFSHPTTFIKNIAGAATISNFLGYLPEVRGIPYQQLPY